MLLLLWLWRHLLNRLLAVKSLQSSGFGGCGLLPTVKDQARSIINTAPPPAATTRATRTTHQQTTENPVRNLTAGTDDDSTKGWGPNYKDQIRAVQPPLQALASATGVPVPSENEEPSTMIAMVIETLDDSAPAAAAEEAVEEQPQQLDEDHEPAGTGPPPKNRKHLIWAVTLLLVVVAVLAGVVVALNSNDTGGSSSPQPEADPSTAAPTVSPIAFAQETKLTASDGAVYDRFGNSVAIAGDTLVVGASGSAYVFTRTGTIWTEQAKLTASDGASSDRFGISVAIDGDTIVVGADSDGDNGSLSGSAYVLTRTGTTWSEQAKLTASDGADFDYFGTSVVIAGDTIVVGAYRDDDNGNSSGSAYIFTRTGTAWLEQAKLMASNGAAGDQFGRSVAIVDDTLVVGEDGVNGYNSGSAYVFSSTETTWMEQAKLTASDGAMIDQFGTSVAIVGDTIVVGANWDDDNGTASGSTYVFTRTGTTWTEQAKLMASDGAAQDLFGYNVAIAEDTIVVGAYVDNNDNGTSSGSAYVFTRTGTTWTEQAKLTANDGANYDEFGISVAIAGDTIIVGAAWDDNTDNGMDSGSVYIYDLN